MSAATLTAAPGASARRRGRRHPRTSPGSATAGWARASWSPPSRARSGWCCSTATGYIAAVLRADPYLGDSGTLALVLGILSMIFLGIAIYVGAIVTANTFSTVVAGRTRRIALMRLVGASARSQRADVARQGLLVGVIGAVVGLLGGHRLRGRLRRRRGVVARHRRRVVRRRPALAARAGRDRRPDDVGRRVGRIPPRAVGDTAAGARRFGRDGPRRDRGPQGPQRRGDHAVRDRRPAAGGGHRARARLAVRCDRRVLRRAALVLRTRGRRRGHHAAGAEAGRPVVRPVGSRRASPPRTRSATRSVRRAWRSGSSSASR